jgi:two-component system, NtrC family, response regulator HupR/HoxA
MINWKDTSGLHVIQKLEGILTKWFNVEIFYIDNNSKVRGKQLDKDYQYLNTFMKVQMRLAHGHDYLEGDLERINEKLLGGKDKLLIMDAFFPHVKMIAAPIVHEGEYMGSVVAYPFVMSSITSDELKELQNKLTECGVSESDVDPAIENLKKLRTTEGDHFRELMELVSEEVITFHEEISKREERIQALNSELGEKYRYHNMVGKSKKMQHIYTLLQKISNSESSVFIQGENGTGKELVAKAIHFSSPRKDRVFLAVNCSAFNDNLLDSELFGHVKGAFTGAIKDKKGLFEQANCGTLFLDEIGDTSLSMQVKLLRVLQEGTYLPVGSPQSRKCDVRLICATNRNLKEMMARGDFREDLFYRINVINVTLPPLRDRVEDIPLLMDHFMQKKCGEAGKPIKIISKKCMEKMLDYKWPGNVRELENEIERLVVLSGEDKTITPDLLSSKILDFGVSGESNNRGINMSGSLKDALEELESIMIREGLKRCNYNKSKLAKELGVSRASLIMKVEKYSLDKRRKAVGDDADDAIEEDDRE